MKRSRLQRIRDNLIGRTIAKADYLTPKESMKCGRHGHILVLTLDNGDLALVPVDGDLNEGVPND